MGDHICAEGFCRTCHCRRIAVERYNSPEYRTRHQQGLNRWSDARTGLTVSDDERPMIPKLQAMRLTARTARLVIVRSRRDCMAGHGGGE